MLSIYIVTLGCFPALTVLVEPTHQSGSVWQVAMIIMIMMMRKLTALMRIC